MIQVNSFALIIGIIFFLSFAIYIIDTVYALKHQIFISEYKLTELGNKLKLIELETSNKIAALLDKKEILNSSTILEPSSYFNYNTFYGLITLGSLIFVGYVVQSFISFSYTTFSNSGAVKVLSRIDDGFGYVASSLGYRDRGNNLIEDSLPPVIPPVIPPVEFERLDELSPEIIQFSPPIELVQGIESTSLPLSSQLIHDPYQDHTVILDILNSLP